MSAARLSALQSVNPRFVLVKEVVSSDSRRRGRRQLERRLGSDKNRTRDPGGLGQFILRKLSKSAAEKQKFGWVSRCFINRLHFYLSSVASLSYCVEK